MAACSTARRSVDLNDLEGRAIGAPLDYWGTVAGTTGDRPGHRSQPIAPIEGLTREEGRV